MKKIFIVAAVIFSSPLFGQQDSSAKILDEVVITTNKYPKKQTETGKVITVITKQQLEKNEGKSLGEILNTIAGITAPGSDNVSGSNLTLNIRGASAGNALILVDGIPVNDPSNNNNYFDLNFFPVEQIERIEILKGGQSTLYGSDAVAGVMNIITKKPGAKKFDLNAGVTGGSYATFKESICMNGNLQKWNYELQYTHISSDGFSAAYDSSGNKNFDKDGFDQHAISGNFGINLSKKLQAKIFGRYSFYKTGLDEAAFTDDKDYTAKNKNAQAGAGFIYNHSNGSLHFNYLFNYVSRDYLDDSTDRSNIYAYYSQSAYIGRTHFAELYNNWKCPPGRTCRTGEEFELLAGIDYRYNNTWQRYFSFGLFGPYSSPALDSGMWQLSPYASLIYKNKKGFNVELGGRWNYHSTYGNNFTFTFNPFYLINGKAKIFANLYSAFKAPTLYQLFDPYAGNKNLQPEKAIIGEMGTEIFSVKNFFARITGFYRNTKNAIVYTYNPSTYASLYLNASREENYGAELEANYKYSKWDLSANYIYTDGKTRSVYDGTGTPIGKDTSYYNLYRIPKHSTNLRIGFQANEALWVSAQLHSVSKREEFIFGAAPQKLDAYTILNLYGEYKWNQKFKVFLDLKNITDRKYFEWLGYNTRRFNFTAGMNFNL